MDWFSELDPYTIIAIAAGVSTALALLVIAFPARGPVYPHYIALSRLVTRGEWAFFGVLDAAVHPDYRVFAKVRVADVITPAAHSDRSRWFQAFNQISAKHFDFVLCDPVDLTIKAVVELDDRSHDRPERRERDALLDEACAQAGVPLVHIKAARRYNHERVRARIEAALAT